MSRRSAAAAASSRAASLGAELVERFVGLEQTQRVLEALRPRAERATGGLWGGSQALLIAALAERRAGSLLVVAADDELTADLEGDLESFGLGGCLRLVEQDIDVDGRPEATTLQQRMQVLQRLGQDGPHVLLAGLAALLDPAPRPAALRGDTLALRTGERIAQEGILARAEKAGLRRVPVVLGPGEISRRGDVLDVFPLGAPIALRLEFFDDELESMRSFDPGSQRSLAVVDDVTLAFGGGSAEGASGHVLEHAVRPDLLVVLHEPLRLDERRQQLALHRAGGPSRLHAFDATLGGTTRLAVSSLPSHDLDYKILSAGSAVGSGEADPVGRLRAIRGVRRGEVVILCRTDEERQRLADVFAHRQVDLRQERVRLARGALSRGFRVADLDLCVISNVEFAGVGQVRRVRERPALPTKALRSFFELGPGDLVVHAAHGIARFEGIERIERGDGAEDHLRLAFRDEVELLVPASKVHLVQKYVGAGGASAPQLDRLGGRGFQKRVQEVSQSLFDLAADLLDVQSKRARLVREPYPRDPLEDDLLDAFPFSDTPDQARAWSEIRADLEGPTTSDRLLCGDVGFGKTELAMRAAFKVAITGRQVAVLAPTTVLAEQHGRTFGERMGPLGIEVGVLTRFVRPAERRRVLKGVADGSIDVVIGTHRLLGKDVQPRRLGLLIVDEEQRFGVRHKEQLKQMRLQVDVLTLSATPIPRTLHASLLGVRSISTLSTPPPGRQDVETRVAYWDGALVAEALQRELGRGGQVFVVHNRIDSLERLARGIRELAPDARVAIGHGQMTATEIEKTIRWFVRGDADVLVSTAIVENGLDIVRANTILIDRADRFGLAELHQLRGRVGRSDKKAYCYLLLDRSHPPREDAKKRLKAVEELSHLGAGFAIAMKDLEIRGAGNLLGPQQSGHIAAVGYEMYCDLLRGAVEAAKNHSEPTAQLREVDVDLRLQAYLPNDLAMDPKERLELLREMDGAIDAESARQLAENLTDRFGTLPAPMVNLLQVFLLKHLLLEYDLLGVQFTGDRVVVRHPAGQPLGGAWLDAFSDVRPVEAGKTHLMLPRRRHPFTGEAVLALFLEALVERKALHRLRAVWRRRRRR